MSPRLTVGGEGGFLPGEFGLGSAEGDGGLNEPWSLRTQILDGCGIFAVRKVVPDLWRTLLRYGTSPVV